MRNLTTQGRADEYDNVYCKIAVRAATCRHQFSQATATTKSLNRITNRQISMANTTRS